MYGSELNKLRPYSIGLDDFLNFASQFISEPAPVKFPPYNIHRLDEYQYKIEMALAGYKKEDIEITSQDGVLNVKSIKQSDPTDTTLILHKGISNRSFSQSFGLADNIIVKAATLEDGMLTIHLERIVPEEKKRKTISIQ